MSAKMKRRRRQARHKRVEVARRHRAEDRRFFDNGTIPPSASVVSICSCGAKAFSRDPREHLEDFAQAHAYCGDEPDTEAVDH